MPDSKNVIPINLSGPTPVDNSVEAILKRANLNMPVVAPVISDPTDGPTPVPMPVASPVPGETPIPGPALYNFPDVDPAGMRSGKDVSPRGTAGSMPPSDLATPILSSTLGGGRKGTDAASVDFKMPEVHAYLASEDAAAAMAPKGPGAAGQFSIKNKNTFIPCDDGSFYLNGNKISSADMVRKYPEAYQKIMAAKGDMPGTVTADTRSFVGKTMDNLSTDNPVGQTLTAIKRGFIGEAYEATGVDKDILKAQYGRGDDLRNAPIGTLMEEAVRDVTGPDVGLAVFMGDAARAAPGAVARFYKAIIHGTAGKIGGVVEANYDRQVQTVQKAIDSRDPKTVDDAIRGWIDDHNVQDADMNTASVAKNYDIDKMSDAQKMKILEQIREDADKYRNLGKYVKDTNEGIAHTIQSNVDSFMRVDENSAGAAAMNFAGDIAGGIGQLAVLSAVPGVGPALAYSFMVSNGYAEGYLAARRDGLDAEEAHAVGISQGAVTGAVLALAHVMPAAATSSLARDVAQKITRGIAMATANTGGDIATQKLMYDRVDWSKVPEKFADQVKTMVAYELGGGISRMAADYKLRGKVTSYESDTGIGAKALVADIDRAIDHWTDVLTERGATVAMRARAAYEIRMLETGKGINITDRSSKADADKAQLQMQSLGMARTMARLEGSPEATEAYLKGHAPSEPSFMDFRTPKEAFEEMRAVELAKAMARDGYGQIHEPANTNVEDVQVSNDADIQAKADSDLKPIPMPEAPTAPHALDIPVESSTVVHPGLSSGERINVHPKAIQLTASDGENNRPVQPNADTVPSASAAQTAGNRAAAFALRRVIYPVFKELGAPLTEVGNDGADHEHSAIKELVNGLAGVRGYNQIASRLAHLGADPRIVEAVKRAGEIAIERGADLVRGTHNTKTDQPMDPADAARRSMEFAQALHGQLQEAVRQMPIGERPEWLTGKVNEDGSVSKGGIQEIGDLLRPGGLYDNAFRHHLNDPNYPMQQLVREHAPAQPIAPLATSPIMGEETHHAQEAGTSTQTSQGAGGRVSEAGPRPSTIVSGGREDLGRPGAIAAHVERSADPEQLLRLEEAPQVSGVHPVERVIDGRPFVVAVEGRFINITSPRPPRNPDASAEERMAESKEWTAKPMIVGSVDADGHIMVGMVQNGGDTGLGKHLYNALAETAVQHFGIAPDQTYMFGEASPEATKSRLSYPGTIAEPSTIAPGKMATATPVRSVLDYKIKEHGNGEGSVSTQATTQEAPADHTVGTGVSDDDGQGPGGRGGSDATERDLRGLLGQDSEAPASPVDPFLSAPEHMREALRAMAARAIQRTSERLDEHYPEGMSAFDQIHDGTNWGEVNEAGAPPDPMGVGPSSFLYPSPVTSPWKVILNGSSAVLVSDPVLLESMLGPRPAITTKAGVRSGPWAPMTGAELLANMLEAYGTHEIVLYVLKNCGFDAMAVEATPGHVWLVGTDPSGDVYSVLSAPEFGKPTHNISTNLDQSDHTAVAIPESRPSGSYPYWRPVNATYSNEPLQMAVAQLTKTWGGLIWGQDRNGHWGYLNQSALAAAKAQAEEHGTDFVDTSKPLDLTKVSRKGKYFLKDQAKAQQANQFIGRGTSVSSTAMYARAASKRANMGVYTPESIVFVSAEGNRENALDPDFKEIQKAIDGGATLLTDIKEARLRPYNSGERKVADYLSTHGMVEVSSGVWTVGGAKPRTLGDNSVQTVPVDTDAAKPESIRALATPEPPEVNVPEPTYPIEDQDQQEAAVKQGLQLIKTHHITSEQLMTLARAVGVPFWDNESSAAVQLGIMDGLSDRNVMALFERMGVEQGLSDPNALQTGGSGKYAAQSTPVPVAPGDTIHKFMSFIRDGGFQELMYALSHNDAAYEAIMGDHVFGNYTNVAKGLLRIGDMSVKDRRKYMRDLYKTELVTDENGAPIIDTNGHPRRVAESDHSEQLEILRRMVEANHNLTGFETDPETVDTSRSLSSKKVTPEEARLGAMAAVAAAELTPGMFSLSERSYEQKQQYQLEHHAYDTPEQLAKAEAAVRKLGHSLVTVPPLMHHFKARIDRSDEGFDPNQIYSDEALMHETNKGVGFVEQPDIQRSQALPSQRAFNSTVLAIAARGGFTPESMTKNGVVLQPKIDHDGLHAETVNRIFDDPAALRSVGDAWDFLSGQGSDSTHLVSNGYKGLMLNWRAGYGKSPFHMDAYRIDPTFSKFYTLGEQTVIMMHGGDDTGRPAHVSVMSETEMDILLDHNHPMYDQAVESYLRYAMSNPQLVTSTTPMRLVTEITPEGKRISRLVPSETVHQNYSRVNTVSIMGTERPSVQPHTFEGLRISDPKLVARRVRMAMEDMIKFPATWHEALGNDLMEQFATAQTIMDATNNADSKDFGLLFELETGPEGAAKEGATRLQGDETAYHELHKFIKETRGRLHDAAKSTVSQAVENAKEMMRIMERINFEAEREGADVEKLQKRMQKEIDALKQTEDTESFNALSEAEYVMDKLTRGKNNIEWERIFSGMNKTGIAPSIPTIMVETALKNKSQMMAILADMGITRTDPKTSYMWSVFNKLHPAFFSEMGFQIEVGDNPDTSFFDWVKGVVHVAGGLKQKSASRAAYTMMHEISHGFTRYMSLRMYDTMHRWFVSARDQFMGQHPIFNDVMNSSVVNPITGETMTAAEAWNQHGTGGGSSKFMITPNDGAKLLRDHPELTPMMVKVDVDEQTVGYRIDKSFSHMEHRDGYRFLTLAEFGAETMVDGMRGFANRDRKAFAPGPRKVVNEYTLDDAGPGVQAAYAAFHRNIGRFSDAIIGKATMRNFLGWMTVGGKLDSAIRNNETVPLELDAKKGGERWARGPTSGAPPEPKTVNSNINTPEVAAKRELQKWEDMGKTVNVARAFIMRGIHAQSVNAQSLSALDGMRQISGELKADVYNANAQLWKRFDACSEAAKVTNPTRRYLQGRAEATPDAKRAAENGMGTVLQMNDEAGVPHFVNINHNGKYDDAVPVSVIKGWDAYEKTGKFEGPMAGNEGAVKNIVDHFSNGLTTHIMALGDLMCMDPEDIEPVFERLTKAKFYIPRTYRPRTNGEASVNPDAGMGVMNSGYDPSIDYGNKGIMVSSLMPRKFETWMDALKAGHFPVDTNFVGSLMSGLTPMVQASHMLKALGYLHQAGLAKPGFAVNTKDGSDQFVRLGGRNIGITDEMLGGTPLSDLRVQPDALRVYNNLYSPMPFTGKEWFRHLSLMKSIYNSLQLFGPFDFLNGLESVVAGNMVTNQGREEERLNRMKRAGRNKAILGATAIAGATAGGTIGSIAGPIGSIAGAAAGAAAGVIGTLAGYNTIQNRKLLSTGWLELMGEGKAFMELMGSPQAMHPETLPRRAQEDIMAAKVANIRVMDNPIQIERTKEMAKQAFRKGKYALASFNALATMLNKPYQWSEMSAGSVARRPISGKLPIKIGGFLRSARVLMDGYRLADGKVDFTNADLRRELRSLSDDYDNQVGMVEPRNLTMNPTLLTAGRLIMRAFLFSYTTQKMFMNVACDFANNLGNVNINGRQPFADRFNAFRRGATAGGTERPLPKEGSNYAWRFGTQMLKNGLLTAVILARLAAVAGHIIWPGSHYTQSRFINETMKEIQRHPGGSVPGEVFSALLSIVPEEGSSLSESLRHVLIDSIAPEFGRDNPASGHPDRFLGMGAMYAKNAMNLPLAINPNPTSPHSMWSLENQWKHMSSWVGGSMSPEVQVMADAGNGHDNIGRPLGVGDPWRGTRWGQAVNHILAARPEDGELLQAPLKALGRSVAHGLTSGSPLSFRDSDQAFKEGGSMARSIAQTFGMRGLPAEESMTEAQRLAYDVFKGKVVAGKNIEAVGASRELTAAKRILCESGDTSELNRLKDEGIITAAQYTQTKNSFMDKHGTLRPALIRTLRSAGDSGKDVWMSAWTVALPREKDEIRDYLSESYGAGYSKIQREKNLLMLQRMERYDEGNAAQRLFKNKIWSLDD